MTGAAATAEAALGALVDGLEGARLAGARVAGRPPLGVRAVESAAERRSYLLAFDGPAFLCLDARLAAEGDARRAHEAASAGLLWEHVEALVDASALRGLVAAIGRVLAQGDDPLPMTAALETVAARALELAAWRDEPMRALASLPSLDEAVALHERLVGAWARFVRASEPLVAAQDSLPADRVATLRAVEEAAAAAGASHRLADRLAGLMPDCEDGAAQMLTAHLTPLAGEGPR